MNKKVWLRALAVCAALLMVAVAACAPQPSPTPTPPPAAKEAAPPAGKPAEAAAPTPTTKPAPTPTPAPKTLVIVAPETPPSLDIQSQFSLVTFDVVAITQALLMDFETKTNPDGLPEKDLTKPKGWLVESWEVSPDYKTFTFRLRKGVKSPFGNEMTADDVKWAQDRGFGIKSINQLFAALLLGMAGPDSLKVVDRYTFQIVTERPSYILLHHLNNPSFGYVYDSTEIKKHATADDPWATKWMATNVAGFGPYKVTKYAPGQEVIFEAWEGYLGGKPKIDRIVYRAVPSSATRLALLVNGDVDVALDLSPKEMEQVRNARGVKVTSWKGTMHNQVIMNSNIPPFNNKKVRQAISYAIPYDDIVKTVFQGRARRWHGPIPDILPEYLDIPHQETNLEKAKALLAEAGFPQGFKAKLAYTTFPEEEEMAILIRTSLAKIGIDVDLDKQPVAVYDEKIYTKAQPFAIWRNLPLSANTPYAMILYYLSQSGINAAAYNNPEIDKLIGEGFVELDAAKRKEIWTRAQRTVLDDAPWAWLVHPGYHMATRANVVPGPWHDHSGLVLSEWDKQ